VIDPWSRPWPKKATATARNAARANALHAGRGEWLVRRSLAAPIFDGVAGVTLRDVSLQDWVYLDVTAEWPMDRAASQATWEKGFLKELRALAWSRPPPARIFRVGEAPQYVFLEAPLAQALSKATRGALGTRVLGEQELRDNTVARAPSSEMAPLDPAPKSEAAFWAGGARAEICKSPHWAYWLARAVDRKPRPDTRRAAQAHPFYAAMYAIHVEKKPSPAAEKAAAGNYFGAMAYAQTLAPALPKRFEPMLAELGWDLRALRADITALRRT
jgi:hypothetical protein